MKKGMTLILLFLLMLSVIPATVTAAASEIQIWHEDFEEDDALANYNLTAGDGSLTVENNETLGSQALAITSGVSLTTIEKDIDASWTFNTNDNIVVSFDFLVTDTSTMLYIMGMDDYAHENNSEQKHEYFCRMKYVDATGTYMLLRNPGNRETEADCYLADVDIHQKNRLTIVFVPRKHYFAVSALYLNDTKCPVTNWRMSGIPANTLSKLRFSAQTSAGTSTAYFDNIQISHFNATTLAYSGSNVLNEVNPYNPIGLEFDHHLKNVGSVTLRDSAGTAVASAVSLNGKNVVVTPEEPLSFNSSYTLSAEGVSNVFDASVSVQVTVNTVRNQCAADGGIFKSYELEEVKILLRQDMEESDFPKVSFTSDSGTAPVGMLRTVHENGNIYLLIPISDYLRCGEVYTISLKAVAGFETSEDITFRIAEGVHVSKPIFTGLGAGGGLATGTLTATVTTDGDLPTMALLLLYYKENKLIDVSCQTISPQSNSISTSVTITDNASDCYVKAYVVDGLDHMRPLSKSTCIGR